MAQKVSIELIDDIDGTPITDGGTSTTFALDGVEYEIDLSESNRDRLRSALADFIDHGRKAGGRRRRAGGGTARRSDGRNAAARAWAQENGHDVNPRGRVPSSIIEMYEAAQRGESGAAADDAPAPAGDAAHQYGDQ